MGILGAAGSKHYSRGTRPGRRAKGGDNVLAGNHLTTGRAAIGTTSCAGEPTDPRSSSLHVFLWSMNRRCVGESRCQRRWFDFQVQRPHKADHHHHVLLLGQPMVMNKILERLARPRKRLDFFSYGGCVHDEELFTVRRSTPLRSKDYWTYSSPYTGRSTVVHNRGNDRPSAHAPGQSRRPVPGSNGHRGECLDPSTAFGGEPPEPSSCNGSYYALTGTETGKHPSHRSADHARALLTVVVREGRFRSTASWGRQRAGPEGFF